MTRDILMIWIFAGAAIVAGYFIIKHLMLRHMARGGDISYSGGGDGVGLNFSSTGDTSGACSTSDGGSCGDGGGGGGD